MGGLHSSMNISAFWERSWSFLFRDWNGDRSIWRLGVKLAVLTSVPVVSITVVASLLHIVDLRADRLVPNWHLKSHWLTHLAGILDVVLLSPLVETGLTLVPIRFFRFVKLPENWIPVLCAVVWALVHWHYNGTWLGLIAIWPFYWFTRLFILLEAPSLDRAWFETSMVHALHNVICLSVASLLAH